MDKRIIDFSFQAPYYKLGNVDDRSKSIWVIFHGYGQLVSDFIEKFKEVNLDENVLIFPQGLSTFYLKGVADKIGANWMTSHEREIDILNYINYLDKLYQHEIMPHSSNIKLKLFGFSQGGHTVSRWISHSKLDYEKLVLWGTSLAHEINREKIESCFSKGNNEIIIGDQDRFIDQQRLSHVRKRYTKIGFSYNLKKYSGGHDIYPEILKEII